ncbi:MAG: hypothetical protein IJH39_05895 [Clostridia bacterium]|nr:hypothetical protein [Clostridia bacterium]
MQKILKQNKNTSTWLRPWNLERFDNLYNRDERFFAILMKGTLAWLTQNILLYNKGINHFIFTTGSSYLYVESNGYNFSMSETTGEDYMYMKMPRCVLEIGDIQIPLEELSAPYVRGQYERLDGNDVKGYNAEMRRLPIEMALSARYVLSNFNESIILIQELIDKVAFQQYFNVVYLGQVVQCSIELDSNYQIQMNKVDMESTDTNQKLVEIQYKVSTNYPCINERTEVENQQIIETFKTNTNLFTDKLNNKTDSVERTYNSETFINLNTERHEYTNGGKDKTGSNIQSTPAGNSFTNNDSLGKETNVITDEESFGGISNDDYKETHILQYKNNDLLKTTFAEIKNNG